MIHVTFRSERMVENEVESTKKKNVEKGKISAVDETRKAISIF